MRKKSPEVLHAELDQKRKELDLVLAIDHIRDATPEPAAMLTAIANELADRFQADLCLICLLDRETGELELKAINDRRGHLGTLGITQELAGRLVQMNQVTVWKKDEIQSRLGLTDLPEKMQLVTVPIILGQDKHLGALLMARSDTPFDAHDVALLKIAESQLDSAVIQGYAHYDLQQRNKELETIYCIDRIRDQDLPFDEMLNAVLYELQTVIQAQMGFVMLYNQAGQKLELRASTHHDLFQVSSHYEALDQIANEALQRAELIFYKDLNPTLRSLMCIPLILRDEIIGVLGVVNRYGPRGFDADDRRLFRAIASQMDTAIFESLEQRRLRRVLGRSVDPRVMERLLDNADLGFLKGERAVLSVLYADLRGSTNLAERTEPELLVGFVNDYLGRMTEVILSHEGTLDKFVGDEVMALFGAPFAQPDHALRAARVGLKMQTAHQVIMDDWKQRGIEPTPMGVGIASGELIVGEMGSVQRTDYTVIGRAANLGARICGVAKPGQVLVSQATYDLIQGQVEAIPITGLQLKGVDQPVTAYHVVRIL